MGEKTKIEDRGSKSALETHAILNPQSFPLFHPLSLSSSRSAQGIHATDTSAATDEVKTLYGKDTALSVAAVTFAGRLVPGHRLAAAIGAYAGHRAGGRVDPAQAVAASHSVCSTWSAAWCGWPGSDLWRGRGDHERHRRLGSAARCPASKPTGGRASGPASTRRRRVFATCRRHYAGRRFRPYR